MLLIGKGRCSLTNGMEVIRFHISAQRRLLESSKIVVGAKGNIFHHIIKMVEDDDVLIHYI